MHTEHGCSGTSYASVSQRPENSCNRSNHLKAKDQHQPNKADHPSRRSVDDLIRAFLMLQEPAVELHVVISVRPGVVPQVGIERQPNISATLF